MPKKLNRYRGGVGSRRLLFPKEKAPAVPPRISGQPRRIDMAESISRARVERIARICNDNYNAGVALGITPGSFGRLCRRYGIETPQARRRRRRQESQSRTPHRPKSKEPHPWHYAAVAG